MGGSSDVTVERGPSPLGSSSDLLAQAVQQYPILSGLNLAQVTTPMKGDNRMLEFWPPAEEGDKQFPRPQGLPMDRPGLQIISPDTKPSDVAADIVSHYLVNTDPTLKAEYQQFANSFNNPAGQRRLHEDYKWDYDNAGERRPFDQWAQTTRIPDYLRGYAFQQWPEKAYSQMYTPDQLKILDQIKAYIKAPRK